MYAYAIGQLQVALHTAENNAPINEREGRVDQAAHDRKVARSYRSAIALLEAAEKRDYERTRELVDGMRPFPE